MSVKTGLNMAMCGIPWWNSDIGGFWGADIESEYFRELIVRWFQFGVFSPVMRLHGSRRRTQAQGSPNPNLKEPSGGPNEIWSFGEKVYSILRDLIELRERLRPYIHKYMDIASKTGAPIMRPMFLNILMMKSATRSMISICLGKISYLPRLSNKGRQSDKCIFRRAAG